MVETSFIFCNLIMYPIIETECSSLICLHFAILKYNLSAFEMIGNETYDFENTLLHVHHTIHVSEYNILRRTDSVVLD